MKSLLIFKNNFENNENIKFWINENIKRFNIGKEKSDFKYLASVYIYMYT